MESTRNSHLSVAQLMNQEKRKRLALTVIKNEQTITEVAGNNKVNRKFVHALKDKAIAGVGQAFTPKKTEGFVE